MKRGEAAELKVLGILKIHSDSIHKLYDKIREKQTVSSLSTLKISHGT